MKSYWIWNYGDWELFHSNAVNSRRQQYGMDLPAFWKMFDVDRNVFFNLDTETLKDGELTLYLKGIGNITIDGKMHKDGVPINLPKGKHFITIHVYNPTGLPAAFIESDIIATNGNWFTNNEKQENIPVGFDEKYTSADSNPELFPFAYKDEFPISQKQINNGVLFEFEKEIFGFLHIENVEAEDKIHVSYGESLEEALDTPNAVVQEDITGERSYKLRQRAFKFIYITGCKSPAIWGELEYQDVNTIGSFRCDNDDVNKIWNISAYTLLLNMREVLTEAIKRDRWLWGGDAYQAFKFIKYLSDDKETTRRSLIGLRGKEPFVEHINTITDYSLFWVIGLYEYYQNYKDIDFINFIYPKAETLMDFCKGREDEIGFITNKYNDWIFIDWSDMDKTGALCAEQMLYIAANRAMVALGDILNLPSDKYLDKANELTELVNKYYWNEEKGAYIDSFVSGKNNVTRHANIFAIMYDIADDYKKQSIIDNVLNNDSITKITTPYFEGYELDVMGKTGNLDFIYNMINTYWKGMLDLGATTVWEAYDPNQSGVEHYAMYGDKFQKSLCHAWGASPIYLLGRYFLGVEGTSAGYETFKVSPRLGKFGFVEGTVPVRDGKVDIYLSKDKIKVLSTVSGGTLVFDNKEYELEPNVAFEMNF